jgi:hypothetical protein
MSKTNELLKKLNGKVVYLASPYTALFADGSHDRITEEIRYKEILKIAAYLTKQGLVLIPPIVTSHNFKVYEPNLGTTWDFWKKIDTALMNVSHVMVVAKMDGWDKSVGVTAEIQHFTDSMKTVLYFNPKTQKLGAK